MVFKVIPDTKHKHIHPFTTDIHPHIGGNERQLPSGTEFFRLYLCSGVMAFCVAEALLQIANFLKTRDTSLLFCVFPCVLL